MQHTALFDKKFEIYYLSGNSISHIVDSILSSFGFQVIVNGSRNHASKSFIGVAPVTQFRKCKCLPLPCPEHTFMRGLARTMEKVHRYLHFMLKNEICNLC